MIYSRVLIFIAIIIYIILIVTANRIGIFDFTTEPGTTYNLDNIQEYLVFSLLAYLGYSGAEGVIRYAWNAVIHINRVTIWETSVVQYLALCAGPVVGVCLFLNDWSDAPYYLIISAICALPASVLKTVGTIFDPHVREEISQGEQVRRRARTEANSFWQRAFVYFCSGIVLVLFLGLAFVVVVMWFAPDQIEALLLPAIVELSLAFFSVVFFVAIAGDGVLSIGRTTLGLLRMSTSEINDATGVVYYIGMFIVGFVVVMALIFLPGFLETFQQAESLYIWYVFLMYVVSLFPAAYTVHNMWSD